MKKNLNPDQVRFLRATAQRRMGNLPDEAPEQVIQSIAGLQAQELPSAYLAVRARTKGVTEAQVKQLHLEQAALTWTW